jgi:hypothetical protein
MKTKNTMLMSLACALALSAPAAFAFGGGGDGGNIRPEDRWDTNAIASQLERAKAPTRYALHRLEISLDALVRVKIGPEMDTKFASIYQKLFAGPKTVYQALDEAVFDPTNDPACQTKRKTDRDASANRATMHVCFSLPAIAKETKEQSGQFQLVGLVAHEATHLVSNGEDEDQDEADAEQVQIMIQTGTSSSILNSAGMFGHEFKDSIKSIIDDVKNAQGMVPRVSDKAFCYFTSMIANRIQSITNTNSNYMEDPGVSIPDLKGTAALMGALLKSANVLQTCAPPGSKDPNDKFPGRNSWSLREAYQATMTDGNTYAFTSHIPDMPMRRLNSRTQKATQAEFAELAILLQTVHDGI